MNIIINIQHAHTSTPKHAFVMCVNACVREWGRERVRADRKESKRREKRDCAQRENLTWAAMTRAYLRLSDRLHTATRALRRRLGVRLFRDLQRVGAALMTCELYVHTISATLVKLLSSRQPQKLGGQTRSRRQRDRQGSEGRGIREERDGAFF